MLVLNEREILEHQEILVDHIHENWDKFFTIGDNISLEYHEVENYWVWYDVKLNERIFRIEDNQPIEIFIDFYGNEIPDKIEHLIPYMEFEPLGRIFKLRA